MWMIGNRAVQEAHSFDLGQHGLFTYQLLRGFAGAADFDKDGRILARSVPWLPAILSGLVHPTTLHPPHHGSSIYIHVLGRHFRFQEPGGTRFEILRHISWFICSLLYLLAVVTHECDLAGSATHGGSLSAHLD